MTRAYDSTEFGEVQQYDSEFEVVPIRQRLEDDPEKPAPVAKTYDTSYEVDLDGPDDGRTLRAVPVDQPDPDVETRAIIPPHLRSVEGVKSAAARHLRYYGRVFGFHAIRTPLLYLPLAAFWSVVGVFRLAGRQLRWWWQPDAVRLESEAANANDPLTWAKVRKDAQARRLFRSWILGGELVAVAAGVAALWFLAPRWLIVLLALVGVPVLARLGRPAGKPIIGTATVTQRRRKLRSDIVVQAYAVAKLCDAEKPGQELEFYGPMGRDANDRGSQVVVGLPHGKTFEEAMAARPKIASGLDVSLSQVYLTLDRTSHRRHLLWVADEDPLASPAGRTPLLDCKVRDIWKAAPLGKNERGVRVMLPLIWTSVLIGAQPRKGKSFTLRSLLLYVSLDPYVRLSVFDAKGSPDHRKFALIAYSYGFGMLPDRAQGDPIETLLRTLREAKKEVQTRNIRLSELPTSICPDGKLTRDIARDKRFKMPVWVIAIDEFQDYLSTGDTDIDEEIADLLVFLVKQGPSVGIIFIDATQRPSGLGSTGKVQRKFTDFRDQHQTRFALKTSSWQTSNLVLGDSAYSEGFDSSTLPVTDEDENGDPIGPDYRGIGVLYNAPVKPGTIRTYLADGKDAEKILTAARRHREERGTLDGMAAGDAEIEGEVIDPITDALKVMLADESKIQWEDLARRLADAMPNRYAEIDKDTVSSRLRKLGARSINVRKGDDVARGVARADLENLLSRRDQR